MIGFSQNITILRNYLLMKKSQRDLFIHYIINEIMNNNYDGINIDFEPMTDVSLYAEGKSFSLIILNFLS